MRSTHQQSPEHPEFCRIVAKERLKEDSGFVGIYGELPSLGAGGRKGLAVVIPLNFGCVETASARATFSFTPAPLYTTDCVHFMLPAQCSAESAPLALLS